MRKVFRKISVNILNLFKIYEKNRKLHFEIIFALRNIYLYWYDLFTFDKKLSNYFNISGSDKGLKYPLLYNILTSLIKTKKPTILEIGIGGHSAKFAGGKSLQALMFYYKKGKIIGADIIDKSYLDRSNLETVILDQSNSSQLKEIGKKYKKFDLIIDDGSHFPKHQKLTFEILFNFLNDQGVYIIEDMKSSYRKGYGGNPDLGNGNLIQFFSEIVHSTNSEMLKAKYLRKLKQYKNIDLIFFFNNAVLIVKKKKNYKPAKIAELNKSFKEFDSRKKIQGFLELT